MPKSTGLLLALFLFLCVAFFAGGSQQRPQIPVEQRLRDARDRQDLESLAATVRSLATGQGSRQHYLRALGASYEAEVHLEKGRKTEAADAARRGIQSARSAVRLAANNAEYHRLLGTLCGQMIPANLLAALEFGRCAKEEIDRAIALDPHSAQAHLARGVGNYYLPEAFGGGVAKAMEDMHEAIRLDPNLADAWLWLGIALRKAGAHGAAREALANARRLAPQREWIEQQLQKTPQPSK